jgi:hypothetical protein
MVVGSIRQNMDMLSSAFIAGRLHPTLAGVLPTRFRQPRTCVDPTLLFATAIMGR